MSFNTNALNLQLPVLLANGGTNANLTAQNGAVPYSTASAIAFLAATATANQLFMSGASGAPSWSTATYPATTTANQLLYSSSANTVAGLATANNSILKTDGSGVPSWGTPAGILTWTTVSSTSQTMVANNGYAANNASLVTLTLPTTAAVGTKIEVYAQGAGGFKIAQNASQSIQVGNQATTSGTGGSLSSSAVGDSVVLVCLTANTLWGVQSMQGNLTGV